MDQIMKLRAEAVGAGITNNAGSRHTKAFTSTVEHGGLLNEFQMLPRTHGLLNIPANLAEIPGGIRMVRAGKMPPPFHKPISGVRHVKRLFKRFENHNHAQGGVA